MTKDEFTVVVETYRKKVSSGVVDFPAQALGREVVEAICSHFKLPMPWTKRENCDFVISAIKYWGGKSWLTTEPKTGDASRLAV